MRYWFVAGALTCLRVAHIVAPATIWQPKRAMHIKNIIWESPVKVPA